MERQELIDRMSQIENLINDREIIFEVAEELGLKFKKTLCKKCLQDYINIINEELGVVEDASEESGFDCKYKYIYGRTIIWRGHKMNQNTDPEIIREFVKVIPVGYYKIL